MNGTSLISSHTLSNPGAAWRAVSAGDFNGDGKADILWQHSDGTPAIWLMDGITIIGSGAFGSVGLEWRAAAAGDFSGDGKADILWQKNDGTLAVWVINGVTFVTSLNISDNPGAAWKASAAGDFNGDAKCDILFQHTDGTPSIWFMNGTQKNSESLLTSQGPSWRAAGASHFGVPAPPPPPPTCVPWSPGGPSLQQAINSNACVEVQPGTHTLAQRVSIPSGHTLRGVNRDQVILRASSDWQANHQQQCCDTLLTTGGSNAQLVVVENLTVDGYGQATYSVFAGDKMIVRNTVLANGRCSGIGTNAHGVVIDGNIIKDAARGPISCASGGGGGVDTGGGIYVQGVNGTGNRCIAPKITNNVLHGTFGQGLDVDGAHGGTFSNNMVYGNEGIGAVTLYGASYWRITNNTVSHPPSTGPWAGHPQCSPSPAGSGAIVLCQDHASENTIGNEVIGNHATSARGLLLIGADDGGASTVPRKNIIKNNNVIGSTLHGCADDLEPGQLGESNDNLWEGNNCAGVPNTGPVYF